MTISVSRGISVSLSLHIDTLRASFLPLCTCMYLSPSLPTLCDTRGRTCSSRTLVRRPTPSPH
ncbi:hypothetical protein J3F84DRAFT_372026 [Trichoderma pleuroticola]